MECELPAFYECYELKARKSHRCCECSAPIHKGETHLIARGKWDDEISTWRQHLLCANACMFVRDKLNGGDCICFGGLEEFYAETRGFRPDHSHPIWREFRKMIAGIKRRERSELGAAT